MVHKKGIEVVRNKDEFKTVLNEFLDNQEHLRATGLINSNFVNENKGASIQIIDYIRKLL